MYHSIILQADWFEEGKFWNVGASGYTSPDNFDDPESIETNPHCIDDRFTEDEVKEWLDDLAVELLPKTETHVCILLNGNEIKTVPHKPSLLRVCLDSDGTFVVWPWFRDVDDYGRTPLKSEDAVRLMTSGQVPIEIATKDPDDKGIHNYETVPGSCWQLPLQRV